MYNPNFNVKYKEIEDELLTKILNHNNNDLPLEYSKEDIIVICDKLYRDELYSVFCLEEGVDICIIAKKIEDILLMMMENIEFKDAIRNIISNSCIIFDDYENELMLFLFSKDMFYITHKCICEQIVNDKITPELLVLFTDTFSIEIENVTNDIENMSN